MTKKIAWIVSVKIKSDDLKAFSVLVDTIAKTAENEPGTLAYLVNFNENKTECCIFEQFADCNSVLLHIDVFGKEFAHRFMDLCSIESMVAIGNPNKALKDAMSGFSPKWMFTETGFS